MARTPALTALARGLAEGVAPADLLAFLHRHLASATAGARSVILQRLQSAGPFVVVSADPTVDRSIRLGGADADALATLPGDPRVVRAPELIALLSTLRTSEALAVRIPFASRQTVLVLSQPGIDDESSALPAANLAIEFGIALEWRRLAEERALHERLREFAVAAARRVSSPMDLQGALLALCHDTNALFRARATSIWLHDRDAREVVLAASSSQDPIGQHHRANADDPFHLAARALRLDRPEVVDMASGGTVIAPLRGWRRALGAVIIEAAHSDELDGEQWADLVRELARQLSVIVENLQLFEQIVRQRRLLEDTFNSLLDLVIVVDARMRVVQTNNAMSARVGRTREDVVGRQVSELLGDETSRRLASGPSSDPEAASGNATQVLDIPALAGKFAVTVTPLAATGVGGGRVIVARDITVQSRLEAERESLRERLVRSEKLASLGQFVAGIAHEMNNPLQGLLGHLELLMRGAGSAPPLKKELRRIYNDGERAARIVRNLLVFSGTRRLRTRRVTVDRVLSRALANRHAVQERNGIHVVRQQGQEVPTITGDPLLLHQAFLNVIINAEHAITDTGGGGAIEIATGTSDDRSMVVVTIRDSGRGISPAIMPQIFDPFFTTKDVGAGTGLGLAITYGIVQEHGGTIKAENVHGGGAMFTIELPVRRPRSDSDATLQSPRVW